MTLPSEDDKPPSSSRGLTGRLSVSAQGAGFVHLTDGAADVFIPPHKLGGAVHGEVVRIKIERVAHDGRRSGRVSGLASTVRPTLLGRCQMIDGQPMLEPLDGRGLPWLLQGPGGQDNPLNPRHLPPGSFVEAQLMSRAEGAEPTGGRVLRVWPSRMCAELAANLAAASRGFETLFSQEAEWEAQAFGSEISPDDRIGRRDLRSLPWVTIDGESTRDFDDALAAEALPQGGWRLWVGIADVAHYVRPGGALDTEALRRGTSVYLPGTVLPMLPEALSNGLCSLNPGVDRLALVAELEFDAEGRRVGSTFHPAVLHSQARLTYGAVARWLDRPGARLEGGSALTEACVTQLAALHQALEIQRRERSALDFDAPEAVLRLGRRGQVACVDVPAHTVAHRLVEETMIAANVAAAEHLQAQGSNGLYRHHGAPCPQRLKILRQRFDGTLSDRPTPTELGQVLAQDPRLAPFVRLAQVKAIYDPERTDHYGLALAAYAHFTSPIRRYPDLLVHRALWAGLQPQRAVDLGSRAELAQLAEHLSEREAAAASAEREATDRLRLEWLSRQPPNPLPAVVSGVTPAGLFVTLDANGASGLLPAPPGARHDAARGAWVDQSGQEWTLGSPVRVQVAQADPVRLRMSLGWAGPKPKATPGRRPRG